MNTDTAIPSHVPPELVRDFSFWTSPGMAPAAGGDPHAALGCLHQGPRIFYAPKNTYDGGGSWVITRAEDQRRILQDAATFSSNRNLFEKSLGEPLPMVPLEIDPPMHMKYRHLLNPLLSPKRVTAMEEGARARAVALIDGFKASGSCDVMEDFALPFAVGVFLQFLGVSDDRRQEFLGWAGDLLHGTPQQRAAAQRTVIGFIGDLAAFRRREPADDFMSFLLQAKIEDRPLDDKEIRGIGGLLFVAGLDTVATAIGFDMNYLARNPADQAKLRAQPALIRSAVEELLRAYSTVHMLRVATKDVEFEGVRIKAGDRVYCSSIVANRDPLEFPDPDRIDLERENNRHTAFAYGPHRCLGSHLARRELIIGLEEFLARIPPFRIREGTVPTTFGGYVFGIEKLVLAW